MDSTSLKKKKLYSNNSGAKKAHDWAVDQIADLFRTTTKVKTQQVTRSRLWVFVLERIERECRDLVDWEGLTWGGPLPLIGLA